MIEQILPDLYRIEVPLPQNPLKAINSYVIMGQERFLIVDTGMNREECMNALSNGLKELEVDLKKTDFFVTHMHADHSGLVPVLATETSKVYFSKVEVSAMASPNYNYWEQASNAAVMNGFPEDEIRKVVGDHPGARYSARPLRDLHVLREGDTIGVGDYMFRCIETPGHSRGHMCLYEPDKKLFMSGDHVLIDITPNISAWLEDDNPLGEYLASLDKVYDLDVELVLPGHRRVSKRYKERIQELKHHHQMRLDEALSIIKEGSSNAFQVASRMTWDMTYESFELFPSPQKWFAVGEALAHLQYLVEEGKIQREIQNHRIVFSLKQNGG